MLRELIINFKIVVIWFGMFKDFLGWISKFRLVNKFL